MIRERENYNAFLLHFLERLNSYDSIEKKTQNHLRIFANTMALKEDSFIKLTDFATSI